MKIWVLVEIFFCFNLLNSRVEAQTNAGDKVFTVKAKEGPFSLTRDIDTIRFGQEIKFLMHVPSGYGLGGILFDRGSIRRNNDTLWITVTDTTSHQYIDPWKVIDTIRPGEIRKRRQYSDGSWDTTVWSQLQSLPVLQQGPYRPASTLPVPTGLTGDLKIYGHKSGAVSKILFEKTFVVLK